MRIEKKISQLWHKWKEYRLLSEYYKHKTESYRGAGFTVFLFYICTVLFSVWNSPTLRQALWYFLFATAGFLALGILNARRVYRRMAKTCSQQVAEAEFRKRLERADVSEVLCALRDKISAAYPAEGLHLVGKRLEGRYEEEKLAVYFQHGSEDELLTTREVLNILKDCRQEGFTKVRIFTAGANGVTKNLGERYNIDLIIYPGEKIPVFLADSVLWPAAAEVQGIIKKESMLRRRRLAVLKKHALQTGNISRYFIYGLLLLLISWYGLGFVWLNVVTGIFLLGLAAFAFLQHFARQDKKPVF